MGSKTTKPLIFQRLIQAIKTATGLTEMVVNEISSEPATLHKHCLPVSEGPR